MARWWVPIACIVGVAACSSSQLGTDATIESDVSYTERPDIDLNADVYVPSEVVGAPVVVILHGQGGSKDSSAVVAVAERLRAEGMHVTVPDLDLSSPGEMAANDAVGLGEALAQTRCAIDLAIEQARAAGANPGRMVIIGESAGGLLGFVVTQRGSSSTAGTQGSPPSCVEPAPGTQVSGYVSWNGAVFIFDPGSPFHTPTAWAATQPIHSRGGTELRFVLGGSDQQTPQWHIERVRTFADEHPEASVIELEEAGHNLPSGGPDLEALVGIVSELTDGG